MRVECKGHESQFRRQKEVGWGPFQEEIENGFGLVGLRPGQSGRRARTAAAGTTCGSHCWRAAQEEEGNWPVKQGEIGRVEEDNMALSADRERMMVGEGKIAGLYNVNESASENCESSGWASYVVGRFDLLRELEIGSAMVSHSHGVARLTREVAASLGRGTLTVAGRRCRHDR